MAVLAWLRFGLVMRVMWAAGHEGHQQPVERRMLAELRDAGRQPRRAPAFAIVTPEPDDDPGIVEERRCKVGRLVTPTHASSSPATGRAPSENSPLRKPREHDRSSSAASLSLSDERPKSRSLEPFMLLQQILDECRDFRIERRIVLTLIRWLCRHRSHPCDENIGRTLDP